jgi:hypothetical protein
MFKLTKLVTMTDRADELGRLQLTHALNAAANGNDHVVRSMLEPTLPNVYNGGDYIWHVQFASEGAYLAWKADPAGGRSAEFMLADMSLVSHVDSVAYEGGPSGSKRTLSKGAYRTSFFSVNRPPSEAAIRQFDFETYEMGVYIPTIVNWQISRATEASGARRWTHVWEQEYEEIGGLHGAYMLHPYHWAWIDRWYDPESTSHMIDTHVTHTFCNFTASMIADPAA